MVLDKYKCEYCKHIEDNVYKCIDNHLVCEKCAVQFKKLCKCKKMLPNNKQTNPIDLLVKYETRACQYSSFACTSLVACAEIAYHVSECKYRPYKCLGETFGLWTCEWTGRQINLPNHMNTVHSEALGSNFEYFQKSSVTFNPTESWHSINIVNGYVYLLGLREDARNYVIVFDIISKSSSIEKIKFISHCYNDSENIHDILESGKCAILTHNTLKHFVSNGELHFQFKIQRRDDDEFTKRLLVDAKIKVVSPPAKPVANFIFKDKGKVKSNTTKKNGKVSPIIQPVLPSKPSQTDFAPQMNEVTLTSAQASQRSSINACRDRGSFGPCYSPSINKDEDKEIRRITLNRSMSAEPCLLNSSLPIQPYKNIDDKLYRRRYPENCLTKPGFKK